MTCDTVQHGTKQFHRKWMYVGKLLLFLNLNSGDLREDSLTKPLFGVMPAQVAIISLQMNGFNIIATVATLNSFTQVASINQSSRRRFSSKTRRRFLSTLLIWSWIRCGHSMIQQWYCRWKKSCTSWWVIYHDFIHPIIYISFTGFYTSQVVVWDFFHQQSNNIVQQWCNTVIMLLSKIPATIDWQFGSKILFSWFPVFLVLVGKGEINFAYQQQCHYMAAFAPSPIILFH